jgi:hypothetical protein
VLDSGSTVNDGVQVWQQVETADEQLMGWIEAASLSNCGNTNPVSVTVAPAPAILANCPPLVNWTLIYTVQPGNTLAQIANASGISPSQLAQANCITDVNQIVAGQPLRVPQQPMIVVTPSPTPQPQQGAPSKPTNPAPQISSGQWTLTITTQMVGCAPPAQPSTVTTVAGVQVSANLQFLSFSVAPVGNSPGGSFSLQRSTSTLYSGTWNKTGKAVLVVTGVNQGTVNATGTCP